MAFLPMAQAPIDPTLLRRQLMLQLLSQQPQAQGIGGAVGQGLQTLAQGLAGRWMMQDAQAAHDQHQSQRQEALARVLGGAGVSPEMAADMQALGAEDELVGALAGRMFPKSQGLMKVGSRVFDPNTREWVTEAPEEGLTPYQQEQVRLRERQLSLAERRANKPARPGADPLVEVYDPESPTGTRFVPRSQAAGRPGKPASGLQIETRPDGTTSISQGRTPTGAKGQTPEAAAKTQLVDQGAGNVVKVRQQLFEPDGSLNRTLLAKMAVNLPGEGREARMMITQAIRAKLRIETGAVISDEEIEAEYGQFFPGVTDTAENAANRLDQLEQFLRGTSANIRPDKAAAQIDFTVEDVRHTAAEEGMTVDEVIENVAKSRGLDPAALRKQLGL
jgi:hypothetical protein